MNKYIFNFIYDINKANGIKDNKYIIKIFTKNID